MPSLPKRRPARILVQHPQPLVDCGRYLPKRCVGDTVEVSADVFSDGHELLRAVVRWKGPGDRRWDESPLSHLDADTAGVRWGGSFPVDRSGWWTWTVQAWVDQIATWRAELWRKAEAGQTDLAGELTEGLVLFRALAERAQGDDQAVVQRLVTVLDDLDDAGIRLAVEAALDPEVAAVAERWPDRHGATELSPSAELYVDRVRARFGAWYELFPRSWGGLDGVRQQLPRLAELGFDVVYLPPIHPIGRTNRKGRNNALVALTDDPGSPWAIGDETGGHTAVHADLGTIDDVDKLTAAAAEVGIDIALDFAIQCSADHPWLTEHPEWFNRRPDGTLKYAENPPKKYQDIYNVNFDSEAWAELWQALLDVVRFWVDHGVQAFRVDNPHTKPVAFWEWLITEVHREHPDVVFLAEAFTRRSMMQTLAKAGFGQSYTYFTWKPSKWELTEYVTELATSGEQEYFRPNFFVNTPDILTEELQHGGPAKFVNRLVLAATLSPSYGVYSGYEHFENAAVEPGSEEYLDSEKYEVKDRSLDGPLLPMIARLNAIRREHPALQCFDNLAFLDTENEALIAYAKRTGPDVVLCVVTLDPVGGQEGLAVIPPDLGLPPVFGVDDLLTGERFEWRVGRNYVRLSPDERPAHILSVRPA